MLRPFVGLAVFLAVRAAHEKRAAGNRDHVELCFETLRLPFFVAFDDLAIGLVDKFVDIRRRGILPGGFFQEQ